MSPLALRCLPRPRPRRLFLSFFFLFPSFFLSLFNKRSSQRPANSPKNSSSPSIPPFSNPNPQNSTASAVYHSPSPSQRPSTPIVPSFTSPGTSSRMAPNDRRLVNSVRYGRESEGWIRPSSHVNMVAFCEVFPTATQPSNGIKEYFPFSPPPLSHPTLLTQT